MNQVQQDKKDGDVDIRVRIAPNTEEEITEVLYRGKQARLAVPVEKLEDLEGYTVIGGDKDIKVHVFGNHGSATDLQARLEQDVINEAERIRLNRIEAYSTELAGVERNIAKLKRDRPDATEKIAASEAMKIGFEDKLLKLQTDYNNITGNHQQARNFLFDNSVLGGSKGDDRKAARRALQRIRVTKFSDNNNAKKIISKAIQNNSDYIDLEFVPNTSPIGKKIEFTTPITSPEQYVAGLTLSMDEDDNFLDITNTLTTLMVFAVKSKIEPPEFVIETAYPN